MKTNPKFHKNNLKASFVLATIVALVAFSSAFATGGSLDLTFGTNGFVITDLGSSSDNGYRIALQSDGKIMVLGAGQGYFLARYNSDGTFDKNFGAGGKLPINLDGFTTCVFAVQADEKVVLGGQTNRDNITLLRYLANGSALDSTFGTNGIETFSIDTQNSEFQIGCHDLTIQPNGKIITVGSEITGYSNFTNLIVARFNTDGTPDTSFVANGFIILDKTDFPNNRFNYGQAVAVQPDGKIVILGGMQDNDGYGQIALARLNADGSMDTTFGTNGKGTVTAAVSAFFYYDGFLALQADGKIVVVGTASNSANTQNDLAVARFNADGSLDTSFGGSGIIITDFGKNEFGNDLVIQADGRIMVTGKSVSTTSSDLLLMRYNTDGSLDSTFGTNGKVISNFGSVIAWGSDLALQPNGKSVVVGSGNGDMVLARFDMGLSAFTFSKQSSKNGATGIDSSSVMLSWSAAEASSDGYSQSYKYCYYPSGGTCNFSDNLFTTHATISSLTAGTTYYWQAEVITCMNASCTIKDKTLADSGQQWSFTTSAPITPIMISGNVGAANVALSYMDGTLKTIMSSSDGSYSLSVSYGWGGTITPSHACFTFSPTTQNYSNLTADLTSQNYAPVFNPASGCADVNTSIAGTTQGVFGIPPQDSTRASYPGVNNGPVQIASTNSVPIIASMRTIWQEPGYRSSYSELMGLPDAQLSTGYWFPWYNESAPASMDQQFRFGNVDTASTTIEVDVGSTVLGTYSLGIGESTRVSFSGVNNGPIHIWSTNGKKIIASMRTIWQEPGYRSSYSELMGLPDAQLSTGYWFPWYNESALASMDQQFRFGTP